jgi:uncharacterized protein (DUF885 family)
LSGGQAVAAPTMASERLHALFADHWEQTAHDHPEWATWRGDHRFDDRLTDASPAARDARDARERDWLARAQAIDRAALPPADRKSLDVFVHQRAEEVAFQAFEGYRTMSLGSQGGFHTDLADLLSVMPMRTTAQAERLLARLQAWPRRVDQELVWLRRGIELGWVPPRPVLERVLAQIDHQLAAPLDDGPFLEPMRRLGAEVPDAEREALRGRARRTVETEVLPALRRLRGFVAGEYLAAAPADGALWRYPGGARVYDALVASHTTLPLTARQLHDTGLREVARLRREIERTMRDAGFTGDFAQWIEHLNTEPKFFHASPEALLAGYRDIAKRIDPELPGLFAELPRAPYGVRAMPQHLGAETAEYYEPPPLDGSRPGWFNANALAFRRQPRWVMETLVAHEAAPGHHLQVARAAELRDLPEFRRQAGFTAYVEGWALYAETLGFDLGLYRDPYSRFGHWQWQIFRAARLVVDTGIHALGWTREQAIDYLVATSGVERAFCAAEVDRYTSWPGQALAYMTGQLKIVELRERARTALGERFDLRRFHNVVLDDGALPLPVLEAVIDDWIARERAAR